MEASKVKLLPHVLVRLGGISFDVLKDLEFSESTIDRIEKFEKLELEFRVYRTNLTEELKKYSTDFAHFKLIRKLKKKLIKRQLIKVTSFEAIDEVVVDKLLIYNKLLKNKIAEETALEIYFELKYLEKQKQLQIIRKRC